MSCFPVSNVRFISANQQICETLKSAQPRRCSALDSPYTKRKCQLPFPDRSKKLTQKGQPACAMRPQQKKVVRIRNIMPYSELQRLQNASKYMSIEDRLDLLAKQEEVKMQLIKQEEIAKAKFHEIDDKRTLEINEEKKDLFLCDEATIRLYENQDELKIAKRIITDVKCTAVLDTQMKQKTEIENKQKLENEQLENIVLQRAVDEIATANSIDEQKLSRQAQYARELRAQVNERENMRFLEMERLSEEAILQREINESVKQKEEEEARKIRERRKLFRAELDRTVEVSNFYKKLLCEREREEEQRVAVYVQDQQMREKQLKLQKQLAKEDNERKQQRLFDLAKKQLEWTSNREESSYVRQKELLDYEFQMKENEFLMRKKQEKREMTDALNRQVEENKKKKALQIARDESEFNSMIAKIKKEEVQFNNTKEEQQKQRQDNHSYLIQQIGEKASENRRLKLLNRNEGKVIQEEEQKRLSNIRAIIRSNLQNMQESSYPEDYIKQMEARISRKLQIDS